MSSVASQSSSAGCDGAAPCVPKSSLVSTMPRPKICSQRRLTDDARDERVVAVDEPACQAEPVDRQIVAHRVQRLWRAGVDARALRGKAAAFAQLVGRPLERHPLTHDEVEGIWRSTSCFRAVAARRGSARAGAWSRGRTSSDPSASAWRRSAAAIATTGRSRAGRSAPAERIGSGGEGQPEAAEALADGAVEMLDADA